MAGVTVTGLSTIDVNGGTVLPNDVVNYEFKVTNIGNDTTGFYIPATASVTGPATAKDVQIVAYIAPDGTRTAFTSPITIAGAGQTTTELGLPSIAEAPPGVLPQGYSLVLNVATTINAAASSGSDVAVRMGNTGANDNSPATQNIDLASETKTDRIYTVDYTGVYSGEATGSPAVEKQASATQTIKVGSVSQALATILKTRTSYSRNDVDTLNDDVVSYSLALNVESLAPAGSVGIIPGKLVGTSIKVDGATMDRVLISDAVPLSTKLIKATDALTPANWTAVYTTDPLTTSATKATWSTSFDPNATRIGFVYDATSTPIAEGTNITGFGFKVITSGVPTGDTTANILSMAQVFGQTQGNTGPTSPLVYDESGDKSPSNFNDSGIPGNTATLTSSSTTIPSGRPNATKDGIDNNNDNSGLGPNGEDNVITIALPSTLLNGPKGLPGSVGPTNSNDDFTNQTTPIPAGTLPGATINPDVVSFTNSLGNPSMSNELKNVLLVPDVAGFVPTSGEQLPPAGTTVTLSYGDQPPAVYTFDGKNFIFTSGGAIIIPTLAAGQSVSYDVKVDLPDQTPLSTDTGKGFSIPIYAFVDKNGNGRPDLDGSEPTQNRTIDRIYTGFLKLVKEAQILDQDGSTVLQSWTKDSALLSGKTLKDRFIEYRITYTNISIAPTGTGNGILDSKNIVITEDGVNGSNTWAKDMDVNGVIDTSHAMGSVSVTYGGASSVVYSPSGEQTGSTAANDVTKYVHKPGVVIQPQATGTFTFRRKIN